MDGEGTAHNLNAGAAPCDGRRSYLRSPAGAQRSAPCRVLRVHHQGQAKLLTQVEVLVVTLQRASPRMASSGRAWRARASFTSSRAAATTSPQAINPARFAFSSAAAAQA